MIENVLEDLVAIVVAKSDPGNHTVVVKEMVVVEDQVHILDMNQRIVTKSIVGQKVKKNLQLIIIS